MKVTKAVVRLSVEMDGDSGGRELEYLHGGYGSLFPKLEAALAGLEAGGKANVTSRRPTASASTTVADPPRAARAAAAG